MKDYLREFHPPPRLLLGPGPSNVHPRVLQAMAAPLLGYLDPDFVAVMDDVKELLSRLFQTTNNLTLPISGTGTAGMEASLCNILEPGDKVVIAVNGFFGDRLANIASRCGAEVNAIQIPWGKPAPPEAFEEELKKHRKVKAIAVVHAETSTGVVSPVPQIAEVARTYDTLLIVDAVTSLGGLDVPVDRWGIDVCFSAAQKCISAPPGLAPLTVGPRALKAIRERKTRVQSFYLDLSILETYWYQNRVYHHTAPVSTVYALREALRLIMEEGLESRFRRHSRNAAALRAGLEGLGLRLFVEPGYRLDPLTTVVVPEGVDDLKVRQQLLGEYNIEIGGGLGPLRGRVWRIGLMGESCRETSVFALLSALERVLPQQGFEVPVGEGVAAAQRALKAQSS
jgi:alanine-glyoxylate transaminase/serine-glyoxylate transaminase/serine-pyruvate transaminase